ncbi:MAG: PD-(D/E)XK nuclease family protein, partial [Prolixibacteraceae bacterium]|jgi:hypothetical protein|nr:PD-(D/E)XK nuclease family protein [Prolixibacteraceae bacterium]
LSQMVQQPIFSPKIITISELVGDLSDLQIIDQNSLIVELYKVYGKVTGSSESLDEFYYWGEMLLADFNDIDKYLIDSNQLFSNIKSLQEIDYGFDFLSEEQISYLSTFWSNILNARSSEDKKSFQTLWEKLIHIYNQFKAELLHNNWAYEGLVYRHMVEKLEEQTEDLKNEKYAFIGFNALNKCEKKLFTFLKTTCSSFFFWDYDVYYKNMPRHEAAMFIEENLQLYPMPENFVVTTNNFSKLESIDVVAVPGFSGQANYASKWINSNKDIVTNQFDNTAIVLCDETLLLPMLNAVPENVSELNITMGFPIKSSPAFALVKGIIDLDRNSRLGKDKQPIFYFRNVLGLLSNPLLKSYLGDKISDLSENIKRDNKIYLTRSDFKEDKLLNGIFELPNEAIYCKDYIQNVLKLIFSAQPESDSLLKESIYQLFLALNRLHASLFDSDKNIGSLFTKKLFYQLLLRQLERINIPFEGEPLSGLQLMGFLETRSLDFENLILLSFNDDKLPGNSHKHSFIPYSLRKGFGLPVIEQRNAMYSYYFYRLIQRAKNVTLVFDSRSEGMSGGEVSRFVTQLKYEAKHIHLNEKQGVFNFEPANNSSICVQKTEDIRLRLLQYFKEKRISPSALSRYLDCKLKFFLKYIEGINEADDVLEDIDHLVFGRIAHLALEKLYMPFEGKEILENDIQNILSNKKEIETCLRYALEKEYFKKGNFELNGRNLLVYDIIKKYVIRILRYDATIAPFSIMGLEKEFENTIEIEDGSQLISVRYGGVVDRLDKVGENIRVVDYKTGISETKVDAIEKLFKAKNNRNKAAFQTMIYANCVQSSLQTALPIIPAVYGARSVFKADFDPAFQIKGGKLIYQANANEFELYLKELLEEIIDPDLPFSQVENEQACNYCEYNGICNR